MILVLTLYTEEYHIKLGITVATDFIKIMADQTDENAPINCLQKLTQEHLEAAKQLKTDGTACGFSEEFKAKFIQVLSAAVGKHIYLDLGFPRPEDQRNTIYEHLQKLNAEGGKL